MLTRFALALVISPFACIHCRLISMVLGVLLLMGWRDKLNPRLERLYYGIFTILWYV